MFKLNNFKILLLLTVFSLAWQGASANSWYNFQIEVDVKLVTGEGSVYDPEEDEIPGTVEVGYRDDKGAYTKSTTDYDPSANAYKFRVHSGNTNFYSTSNGMTWILKSATPNSNSTTTYVFRGWRYADKDNGIVKKRKGGTNTELDPGTANLEDLSSVYDFVEADKNTKWDGYAFMTTSTNKCTYDGEKGVDKDPKHKKAHTDNPPVYENNAIIYALFEKMILEPAVRVEWDSSQGDIEYPNDPAENKIGNTITITANRKNDTNDRGWEYVFSHWEDDEGNIVSTSNPWNLTIEKKATYHAVFKGKYQFFRVKNYGSGRVVDIHTDETGIDMSNIDENIAALLLLMDNITPVNLLSDEEIVKHHAGTIIQIEPQTEPRNHVEIMAQGANSVGLYNLDKGIAITSLPYDNNTDTWTVNAPMSYFRDDNGTPKLQNRPDEYAKWRFEGIDLDLSTHENYFSLNPDDMILDPKTQKYYTTLRTSWNCRFADDTHNNIKAYIVTGLDDEGVMQKVEVTGGIIPKGVAVLLECNTNSMDDNVLIPTMESATFTQTQNNILKSSKKYFPNQSVEASENFKALGLINGRLGFGGDALTTINGNNGYLQIPNDAFFTSEYTSVTLAELVKTGVVGEKYNVTDLTAVQWVDGNQMLIAKDNNGYATPDAMPEGETWVDYIAQSKASIENDLKDREGITATVPETYDQSNWIALHLAQGKSATTAQLDYAGKRLTGLKGTLLNVTNPELLLEAELGTSTETPANVEPNVYVAASFNGDNHQPGKEPFNDKEYFFVQPKPMELATIGWAQWYAANEQFVVPENVAHPEWNTAGLSGEFGLNGSLMEQGFDMSKLLDGHSYLMPALIKRNAEDYESIYILGNVDGNQFVPNKGVEMYTMDGKTYTATATITKATDSDPNGYIGFTRKLASQGGDSGWAEINTGDYRFGPESNGDFYLSSEYLDQTLQLPKLNKEANSFKVPAGTYLLTVAGTNVAQLEGMTLVVSRIDGSSRAPRRADGTQQKNSYIAYPLRLVQTTSVGEGGVITGVTAIGGSRTVAGVDYYNLAGQRSTQPWLGVNIVVTRYTDGTSSTNKQIKN